MSKKGRKELIDLRGGPLTLEMLQDGINAIGRADDLRREDRIRRMNKKEKEETRRVYKVHLKEMLCVEVGHSHVDDRGHKLCVPVRTVTLQCSDTEPSGLFSRGTKLILSNFDVKDAADEIRAAEAWKVRVELRRKDD